MVIAFAGISVLNFITSNYYSMVLIIVNSFIYSLVFILIAHLLQLSGIKLFQTLQYNIPKIKCFRERYPSE